METLLGNISWPQFLATALLLIVIYYSYIACHYYPEEIKSITRRKPKPGFNPFGFAQAVMSMVSFEHPEPTRLSLLTY